MINEVISMIIHKLSSYKVSIYLVGSLAYEGYSSSWSDIDLVIFTATKNESLNENIKKMLHKVNTTYKGRIAGGGDSPLDIILIIKDEYSGIIKSQYYFSEKYKNIVYSLELLNHGKLIYGVDELPWLKKQFAEVTKEQISKALMQSCLERIHLYHNVFHPILISEGRLEQYAPHKKYKVIPQLYISIVRAILWILHGLSVNKSQALQKFREQYPDLFPEINLAFSVRINWNKNLNQLEALNCLAKKLPKFIEWFMTKITDITDFTHMIFVRGRKNWHYRDNDKKRVTNFFRNHNLNEDETTKFLQFHGQYELTFLECNDRIFAGSLYEFKDKSLLVHKIISENEIGYNVLDYYLYHRALEKNLQDILLYPDNRIFDNGHGWTGLVEGRGI